MDDFRSYVVADIPGIIEGAHEGHGLGIQFLRHIERTRLLVHLVDVSETGRDPVSDFEVLMGELESFSPGLATKLMILAPSKMDVVASTEAVERLREIAETRGMQFIPISSATGQGIEELQYAMSSVLFAAVPQSA